jgi:hypothetical protein
MGRRFSIAEPYRQSLTYWTISGSPSRSQWSAGTRSMFTIRSGPIMAIHFGRGMLFDSNTPKEYMDGVKYGGPAGLMQILKSAACA